MFDNLELTIDDIYKQVLEKLTSDRRIRDFSSRLLATNFLNDDERVVDIYQILKGYGLLPLILKEVKCPIVSAYYRNLGNQHYQQANLYIAWQYYNLAVMYSPLTSDSYGLAIANRSAVFAALKKYKACLKDIELVFSIRYPHKIRDKLLKRQKQCKEALREGGEGPDSDVETADVADILTLKGPRHDKYLSASSKLAVEYSEDMGRHVIAKEDIKVGEIIVQEDPYVNVLLKSQYVFACGHCMARKANLYPCPHCCLTMYCSRPCVEKAWDEYHRYECPLMACLVKMEFTKLELLALRITIKSKAEYPNWVSLFAAMEDAQSRVTTNLWGQVSVDGRWVYDSKYYPAIHTLATNADKRDISDLFQKSVSAAVLLHLLATMTFCGDASVSMTEKIIRYTGATLFRHLMTAPTNMHGITANVENDDGNYVEEYNIGSAPYAFLSLINHSCSPNVVRYTRLGSSRMSLVALRPIKAGSQIFDNYGVEEVLRDEEQLESRLITACKPSELNVLIELAPYGSNKKAHHAVHTQQERQAILKSQYKFTCVCEACIGDWSLYHGLAVLDLPGDIARKRDKILSGSVIEALQKGHKDRALKLFKPLCELATALEPYIPCKESAECQEALKQCLAILSGVLPNGYSKFVEWRVPPPIIEGRPHVSRFFTSPEMNLRQS